jgi:hypothetical protein
MACGGECSRGDEHRVGAADDIVRDGRADRLVARPVVDKADVERRICGRVEVRARWVEPDAPAGRGGETARRDEPGLGHQREFYAVRFTS